MILSWCVIVGSDSELGSLQRMTDSIYPYIDELIITANGKEVKEIEKWCKTLPKIKYFYHKWTKDFSEQRNFCTSQIRMDADWYGWSDADDFLVGGDKLRDIAVKAKKANLDAVFFDYWYSCSFNGQPSANNLKKVEISQTRERLLRPGSITWHKRLHETPIPVKDLDYKYTQVKYSEENPIAWLHLGVTRNMPHEEEMEKMARNRELLELELADERKGKGADPRTLLYLMKIYAVGDDKDKWAECIKMGEEYLTKSGWDAERAMACAMIAMCLEKQGQEAEAKDFLFTSIKEYPYDPILYLYLSRVCFNLKQYHEMKHWLEVALTLDNTKSSSSMTNVLELKILSSELLMEYYFNGAKDIRKAYKAMKLLYKEYPSQDNKEKLGVIKEINDLDEACEEAHKLMLYYQDLNNSQGVVDVVKSMPKSMQDLPFAWFMYNKHKEPRTWKEDEICYYASFGSAHFEIWGPANLKQGIGGSETAVIRLSQEWAKKGYKVVVYCDCGEQEGMHDGVLYLPYLKFNPKDNFNIFINWRSNALAGKIKAKKFICDLHDLFADDTYKNYQQYDKLFVKSEFQRKLAKSVPDDRVSVIGNGI